MKSNSRVLRGWRDFGVKATAIILTILLATQMVGTPAFASGALTNKQASEDIATTVDDTGVEPSGTEATDTTVPDEAAGAANEPAPADSTQATEEPVVETVESATEPATETPAADPAANTVLGAEPEPAPAPAPAVEQDQLASIKLNLADGASITLSKDGNKIDDDTNPVKVPANEELKFTAQAADGWQVDKVKTVIDRVETELVADANGEYKVAADKVTGKLTVKVEAVETAEDLAADATEPEQPEAINDDQLANEQENGDSEAAASSNVQSIAGDRLSLLAAPKVNPDRRVELGGRFEISGYGAERYESANNHEWTVEDESIVTIVSGKKQDTVTLRAEAVGLTTVTHSYRVWDWGHVGYVTKSETFEIQVYKNLEVSIDSSSIEVYDTAQASVSGADGQEITWKSSNTGVATVDEQGVVTGVSEGHATITATAADGSTGSVQIEVTPLMVTVTFDLNGGKWEGDWGSNPQLSEGQNDLEFGSQLWNSGDLKSPVREGYAFIGWTPVVNKTVLADVTYEANWVELNNKLTPVYVYTKVTGDTTGLILNAEGWFTLGVIYLPSSMCNPNAPQNTSVDLDNVQNMSVINTALETIVRYLPNSAIDISAVKWTKLHMQDGANDYMASGPGNAVNPAWHLDGTVDGAFLANLAIRYVDFDDPSGKEIAPAHNTTVRDGSTQYADQYIVDIEKYKFVKADKESIVVDRKKTNEITLYYSRKAASLQYDLNAENAEGTAPETQFGKVDDTVKVADGSTFSRPYSKFVGWNTQANGKGESVSPGSEFVLREGITTLYAQWENLSYVQYDLAADDATWTGYSESLIAGKRATGSNTGTITIIDDDTYYLDSKGYAKGDPLAVETAEPTRPGYEFSCWYYGTDNPTEVQPGHVFTEGYPYNSDKEGDDTLTFHAKWTPDTDTLWKVEVYYQANGTYEGVEPEVKTYENGTTDQKVSVGQDDYAKTGYVFDASQANLLEATCAGDGSTVLKVYYKQQFTVTYQPGAHAADGSEAQSTGSLDWGADTPAAPSYAAADGYSFQSWSPAVAETVTGDATYVAQWAADTDTLAATGYSDTYDGLAHGVTVSGTLGTDEVKYFDADGNEIDNQFVNVTDGAVSVTAVVSRDGYEVWSGTATVQITPAPLTVVTQSAAKIFDGAALSAPGEVTGFVNGETADWSITGTITMPGKVSNTYDIDWASEKTTALESNYAIDSETIGKLTVYPQSIDPNDPDPDNLDPEDPNPTDPDPDNPDQPFYNGVKVTAPEDVYYNGLSQEQAPVVTDRDGNPIDPSYYDVTYSEDTVNAGTVTITVTGKNGYTGSTQVTYDILKVDLTIATPSAGKVFDGAPLAGGQPTASGWQDDDATQVTLSATGSITNVGSAYNTYTVSDPDGVLNNYNVIDNLGVLTVWPQSIDPTDPGDDPDPEDPTAPDPSDPDPDFPDYDPTDPDPEGPDPDQPFYTGATVDDPESVPYDGGVHQWVPTVTDNEGNTLTPGEDYTVSYSTDDFTNVGTITVTITGTGNYGGSVEKTYQITPAQIVVNIENQTKVQGSADPTFTFNYSGVVEGETMAWTGEFVREVGETVGDYAVTQGGFVLADNPEGNFDASNYTLVVNPGTLTITADTTPVVPDTPDTPTPTPDTPTPLPTPGTPTPVPTPAPGDDGATPTDGLTATTGDDAEEAIDDEATPLTAPEPIDDDATPLASGAHRDCWVHWLMLLGILVTVVYYGGVGVRRVRFSSSLQSFEDDVLGNDETNR